MDIYLDKMIEEYSNKLVRMNRKKKGTQGDVKEQQDRTEPLQEPVKSENPNNNKENNIAQDTERKDNIPTAQTEIEPLSDAADSYAAADDSQFIDDVFTKEHLSVFLPLYGDSVSSQPPPTVRTETQIVPPVAPSTGKASFVAQVFAADQAYPIQNAKVVIRENNSITAFLFTDSNGSTKRIELVAPPEKNSLNPDENVLKAIDYSADIYADGFIPKENQLIEAVGGTDVILKVNLVPQPERVV